MIATLAPVPQPRGRVAGRSGPVTVRRQQRDSIEFVPIKLSQTVGGESSQHGESGVIDAVFGAIGIKSRTCVEFGAFDLKVSSNVYPLWTAGWRALLIEGHPERHAKLGTDYRAHPQHADTHVEIEKRFVAASGPDSSTASWRSVASRPMWTSCASTSTASSCRCGAACSGSGRVW